MFGKSLEFIKKTSVLIIRFYQLFISPVIGSNCRFYPTCSEYSRETIEQHGFKKGFFLSLKRILKCNPFCQGGIDLPPKEFRKQT